MGGVETLSSSGESDEDEEGKISLSSDLLMGCGGNAQIPYLWVHQIDVCEPLTTRIIVIRGR
jgi:hypothetical protein